jgi:hypothetical protein
MKKQIIYTLLIVSLFAGCKKNDGPIPNGIKLERVPEPQIVKNGGSPVIDVLNVAGFSGKFDVSLFYPNDIPPAKLDVIVRKNNSIIKVFQTLTTFPQTLTINAAQLAALFGTPVALGDNYDIAADIYTQSGNKYEAYPAVGAANGTNITTPIGVSLSIRYSAVCAYNAALFPSGNYVVVKDEWGDYAAGEVTTVTQVDATHFKFSYKAAGGIPITIVVDPVTNITSVVKQVYGTLGYPPGWPYGPISAETTPSTDNVILPCSQTISLHLKHTVVIGGSIGSFGEYVIQLKKQ